MNEFLPAVETALSDAWGGTVKLALREALDNRQHVARLAVLVSPPDMPKTVILKRWRSEGDEGFDPNSFDSALFTDWAGLEFTAHIFGKSALTPQLYIGDIEKGFLVIEDLPEGKTLDEVLRGNNLAQAEQAMRRYGESLGKLHAQTLGQGETFFALRNTLGHAEQWESYKSVNLLQAALKTLEALNFEVRPSAYSEVQQVDTHLSRLTVYSALHHGDPAPNNCFIDNTGGFYLFDFESTHFDHALVEGVNPRMGFPTYGMAFVNRVPETIWRQTEAAYLNALAAGCPEAADTSLRGPAITSACALWTLDFCERWLETTVVSDLPLFRLNRLRQCMLTRIDAFVEATREFNSLLVLGETFANLSVNLRSLWPPEAQNLPLYPVFQDGKS